MIALQESMVPNYYIMHFKQSVVKWLSSVDNNW